MLSFQSVITFFLLLVAVSFLRNANFVTAATCKTCPLNLPIRNVSTSPSSQMTRAIAFGIGNPPQHVALHPSLMINSTFIPRYISNNDDCYNLSSSSSSPPCTETYGGGFIAARSSTWNTDAGKANLSAASYDRRFNTFSNWTNGFDTLRLEDASNLGIPSMPVVLPNGAFGAFSNSPLGLGEDSVFISALEASSFIPTKSWGLSAKGLCLGCVDAAAASGTFVSVPVGNPVEKNCALQVNVLNVGYEPANGSAEVGISSGTFPACVEPGSPSLILPQTVIDAHALASGARASSSDYQTHTDFSLSRAKPDGALVFTLAVTVRHWGWGSYEVGTFVLGQPFTDEVYLRYNAAAKTYGIAGSNNVSGQDIQALGCEITADTPSAASQDPSGSSSSGGKFSTGAVVGAAIGGILGAFLLTISGCWLWWRSQKKKSANQGFDRGSGEAQHIELASKSDDIPQLVGRNVHEADAGRSSGYTPLRQQLP